MKIFNILAFVAMASLASPHVVLASELNMILGPMDVAKGNVAVFNTPVDAWRGRVYVVSMEPSPEGQAVERPGKAHDLLTVLRKGTPDGSGGYVWERTVLEDRTIDDPWHTQPSVGIDEKGYVHVAYNMHHLPWQYTVSRVPGEISEMQFRGQPVSDEQIRVYAEENKSPFPSKGGADIPGNQITYPAFFHDRQGRLYVTYRFAIHPARPWKERLHAAGVAAYSTETAEWAGIGGDYLLAPDSIEDYQGCALPCVARPFAVEKGYVVYLPALAFDAHGGMHASWMWRKSGPGALTSNPSYTYIPGISLKEWDAWYRLDSVERPRRWEMDYEYYPKTSITVFADGTPFVLLQPVGESRVIMTKGKSEWREFSKAPYGATVIVADRDDRLWAFASGPLVFYWSDLKGKWVKYAEAFGWKNVAVRYIPNANTFFLYANNKEKDQIAVFELRL